MDNFYCHLQHDLLQVGRCEKEKAEKISWEKINDKRRPKVDDQFIYIHRYRYIEMKLLLRN